MNIDLLYKDNGTGLSNFAFIQTVSTNMPIGTNRTQYIDPAQGAHNRPFYWEKDELAAKTDKDGNVRFWDMPIRFLATNAYWHGELSVVGKNNSGAYVHITTIIYGFEISNGKVNLDPIKTVTPSAFQTEAINSIGR